MKFKKITSIESPYDGVSEADYQVEKRRLQVELLHIQQKIIKENLRLAVVFEGRDAAGKGSTIKRFSEYLIPRYVRTVELGIPTPKESKYWFNRYEQHLPREREIVFFDRSWYTRALIEPTMAYCTEAQYRYFMRRVLEWERQRITDGMLLVKFYLSVDKGTQLIRFADRLKNPLKYWKFSENDLKAREKWELFTRYKEQMFGHTSTTISPWVVIRANKKREARLTAMLYLIRLFAERPFTPLTGEEIVENAKINVAGVRFHDLSPQQIAVLQQLTWSQSNSPDPSSEEH